MGQIRVPAKIESIEDLFAVKQGRLTEEKVRTVQVTDALVDTGAAMLCMPKRLIKQLGLTPFTTRRFRTTGGLRDSNIYGPVKLIVQGRYCNTDVSEVSDECPVLIGQIPLELLDFVVDPSGQKLTGNPEHGGEWMHDMF